MTNLSTVLYTDKARTVQKKKRKSEQNKEMREKAKGGKAQDETCSSKNETDKITHTIYEAPVDTLCLCPCKCGLNMHSMCERSWQSLGEIINVCVCVYNMCVLSKYK